MPVALIAGELSTRAVTDRRIGLTGRGFTVVSYASARAGMV